jgi:hypothetical protein
MNVSSDLGFSNTFNKEYLELEMKTDGLFAHQFPTLSPAGSS